MQSATAKRKGRKAKIVLAVLLAIVLGFGIGAFAYFNHINSLLSLGDREDDVQFALSDINAGEPYNILLLASDSREGLESSDYEWAGHTLDPGDGVADVIILARVDEDNRLVTMLSIPRDTPWQFSDGTWGKLNSVYAVEGVQGIINAVSTVTNAPIAHYVEIQMSGFIDLVDTIGGITVDVPSRIEYHEALTNEPVVIEAGTQRLNGVQAEVFARERKSYNTDQDMNRQSKVRTIVKAMVDELKTKPVWELPDIVASCAKCVSTDYSASELVSLFNAVGSQPTMYSGTGPYAGDKNPNADNLWLCYLDPEGWERVMAVVNEGGDPSTVTYEGDEVTVAGS